MCHGPVLSGLEHPCAWPEVHNSNFVVHLLVASYHSANGSKSDDDMLAIFESDSEADIEGAVSQEFGTYRSLQTVFNSKGSSVVFGLVF